MEVKINIERYLKVNHSDLVAVSGTYSVIKTRVRRAFESWLVRPAAKNILSLFIVRWKVEYSFIVTPHYDIIQGS